MHPKKRPAIAILIFVFAAHTASNLQAELALSGFDNAVSRTTIAVDPTGKKVFVMWTSEFYGGDPGNFDHLRFNTSSDGGVTWLDRPVDFQLNTGVGSSDIHPELAIDPSGKVHLVWSQGSKHYRHDNDPPKYASSMDFGNSWSKPTIVGRHRVGWVQRNGLGLWVSGDGKKLWTFHHDADWGSNDCASSDGGATWTQLGMHFATGNRVDGGHPDRSYCSDAVAVGEARIALRKRNDELNVAVYDGKKWAASTPTPLEGALSLSDDHTMVADSEGAITIIFGDAGKIHCMRSTDRASTWSTRARVDDAPNAASSLPVIGIMDDGTLAAAWQDGREEVSEIRYATSTDAGKTWSASVVLAPTGKRQSAPDMAVVGKTAHVTYSEGYRAFFARVPDVPPLDRTNLFPNAEFDDFDGRLPTGWSFAEANEFPQEDFGKASPGRIGVGSCLAVREGASEGALKIRSQRVPVSANTTYVFKGYYTYLHPGLAEASASHGVPLKVSRVNVVCEWLDSSGKAVGSFEFKLSDTQDDWIAFFKEIRSPENARHLQLKIEKDWQVGSLRLDDFSLRRGYLRDYEPEFSLPKLKPGELRFPIAGLTATVLERGWEAAYALANFTISVWENPKFGLRGRISAVHCEKWPDAKLAVKNDDPDIYCIAGHDEPGKWQYRHMAKKNRRYQRLIPSKPYVINLLPVHGPYSPYPVYRDYVRALIEAVGVTFFTYDHYALGGKPPHYGGTFYPNFEIARDEARRANIHFGFIGSTGGFGGIRGASEPEMRWQAYSALAYGSRYLGWFLYDTPPAGDYGAAGGPGDWRDMVQERDGTLTRRYAMFRRLNAEILALGDTLLRIESTGVFHTKPLPGETRDLSQSKWITTIEEGQWIIGEFEDESGRRFFMLVNRDFMHEQVAVMTLNEGIDRLLEISKTDGKKAPVAGFDPQTRSVTLTVTAGGGRLFTLDF